MLTMEFLIVEGNKKLDSNKYKTNGNRQLIESCLYENVKNILLNLDSRYF